MKNTNTVRGFLSLAVAILCLHTAFCNITIQNYMLEYDEVMAESDVIGTWRYTVDNVPPEYRTGVLSILNENGAYVVQVQLKAGTLKAENISVEGNKIRFKIYLEGSPVSVELMASEDKIKGSSSSSEGTYTIKGERVKPQ
ncbi:hypothetical protein [Pareuzebyella sediminis]|uniref:hypothetical protein n=1 Tax=Pareuzebyella sediminis TaxID=2607998 RepID=UPI0011EB9F8E|nr:hypothetical protein [Pareuzebyella sediminis]